MMTAWAWFTAWAMDRSQRVRFGRMTGSDALTGDAEDDTAGG